MRNPVLFLPLLFFVIIVGIFIILFAVEILILYLIFSGVMFTDPMILITTPIGLLLSATFIVADLLSLIFMGSFVRSMQIGSYMDISNKGKVSLGKMFGYGSEFCTKYFIVQLIRTLIFGLPFMVLAAINIPIYFISWIPAVIISIIFVLIYIVYATFAALFLFFVDPMVVSEKRSPMGIIRYSIAYTKSNMGHVLLVILMMSLISSVVMGVLMAIGFVLGLFSGLSAVSSQSMPGVVMPLTLIFNVLISVVQIILSVFMDMFFVNCYFKKK